MLVEALFGTAIVSMREFRIDEDTPQPKGGRRPPPPYGVSRSTAPIGSRVVLNYDLTPAEWASGSVTMRFLVENYPYKVIPTFSEGSTMFGRYVGYISYSRYKIEKFKTG